MHPKKFNIELKNTLTKIITIFLIAYSSNLQAQDIKTTRDIGLWLNVGVKYKINKKWTIKLDQGFRTYDNAIKLEKLFTEFGTTYNINKKFRLGAGIRYAYARKSNLSLTHDFRYDLCLGFKHKFTKKLQLKYRLKFQHKFANIFTYDKDVKQNSHLRNKLQLGYDLGKHTIYLSSELFIEFKRYQKAKFDNLRFSLGDKFKTKLGQLNYAFTYELELSSSYPLHFFLLNIGYVFEFKRK